MVLDLRWFDFDFFFIFAVLGGYKSDIHPVKAALPVLNFDVFLCY